MSATNFIVKHHTVATQHIRELPNALAVDESTPLHLHVAQYIPRNNLNPQPGDITIVALHANTFTHELYEPLWDDLISALPPNVRIRGIWMADQAQQGQSYILNETKLADGVSWDDHPRDLLHTINILRDQMPPPLIGVGHSMGAAQLVALSKLHPRLFHSVAFLDPWMAAEWTSPDAKGNWKRGVGRKDKFENTDHAGAVLRKSPVMKRWDQRVFDRFTSSAWRNGPTLLHPDNGDNVVLKTPKQMELYTSARVNLDNLNTSPETASRVDRLQFPEMKYDLVQKMPYYMPLPKIAGEYLPHLRPRALFLYGNKGSASREEWSMSNIEKTGTGSGGSGGIGLGAVEADTVSGSHFFPFEQPTETAERLALWLENEANVMIDEKRALEQRLKCAGRSAKDRQTFPDEFLEVAKRWDEKVGSKL